MRLSSNRGQVAVALAAAITLAATLAGCASDEPPSRPGPEQEAPYEQIPEDLCERVPFDHVVSPLDLTLAPWHDPSARYATERVSSSASCTIAALAEDGRFATALKDFEPTGLVSVEVFHEAADAEVAYEQQTGAIESRQADQPDTDSAQLDGWWDRGTAYASITVVDVDDYDIDELDASRLDVARVVHHHNLVVTVSLDALSPARDTSDARALLHDLAAALVDQTADHLPRAAD